MDKNVEKTRLKMEENKVNRLEEYYREIERLDENYKKGEDEFYFRKKMNIFFNIAKNIFPREFLHYIEFIEIDLTNGNGDYHFKETNEYFKLRDEVQYYPMRFLGHILDEANYNIKKDNNYKNLTIYEIETALKILIDLRNEYLKIYCRDKTNYFSDYVLDYIMLAEELCYVYIEKITTYKGHQYSELEKLCYMAVGGIKRFKDTDYSAILTSANYKDVVITLPTNVAQYSFEEHIFEMEDKFEISKLDKSSWEYYIFAFEYLKSVFIRLFDLAPEEIYDLNLYDIYFQFMMLIVFCMTKGRGIFYEFEPEKIELTTNIKFELVVENYWDLDERKAYYKRINIFRYFYYNLNYLYQQLIDSKKFSDNNIKYIKERMEIILELFELYFEDHDDIIPDEKNSVPFKY